MLVQFPGKRVRHGRASAATRAASMVIIEAFKPAAWATAVSKTVDHQSAGMLSRCHHLETREGLAPMSNAMASFEAQSSIIPRNVVGSDMTNDLGRFVLNGKDVLSCDYDGDRLQNGCMAERLSETEETLAFIRRVREAREAKFSTQKPVYSFLGIPQDQYKHYELTNGKGRPLPRRYIPKFCIVTEVAMEWLLTGEGKGGPIVAEIPIDVPKRTRKQPRSRAA